MARFCPCVGFRAALGLFALLVMLLLLCGSASAAARTQAALLGLRQHHRTFQTL